MTSDTFGNARQTQLSNTLAAIFATEHDARDAIKELHKAGFKQTWLGLIKKVDGETGEPLVDEKQGLALFMSADRLPLAKALRQHGLSEQQAQDVESQIAPGCAVLTVYGEDNPERAIELLESAMGDVVEGETPAAVTKASASPRTGVDRDERKEADRDRRPDDNGVRNGSDTMIRNGSASSVGGDSVGVMPDRTADWNEGDESDDTATYRSDVFYQRS